MLWNLMMKSHVECGLVDLALLLYKKMRELGVSHDCFTFPIVNKVVMLLGGEVRYAGMVHCVAIQMGFGMDVYFGNTMIDMYVKCGEIDRARNVACGLSLFNEMRLELEPNSVTMLTMLQGCCGTENAICGSQFDGYVIKNDLLYDASVQNSILRMYAKLGTINEVEDFFSELDRRDVVSWNICISFFSSIGDVAKTSLLDLYAKCGELGISDRLFREIPHRNSITWGAMMFGFIQNGWFSEAVGLFREMQALGPEPTAEILRSLVDAFANLGALKLGKQIHGYIIRKSLYEDEESYTHLETSIINMYIRSGSLSAARVCFDRMLVKDIVTWTSMIEGYGSHGLGFEALKLFDLMIREGIRPNSATFISLLSACSHSGLATEGCDAFCSLKWKFGIEPDLDHYTSIVDLLGRFGKLKEALADVEFTVSERDVGEHAAQRLLELEPDNARYHTLLSNTQASVGQWDEVEVTRRVMSEMDLKKMPGWSCQDAIGIDLNLLIS
ncbi:hypothetical protein ACFX14_033924 [Malus domestica]